MAVRVTATEVKSIMDGITTSDTIVDEFIVTANAIVNKMLESDSSVGTTLMKEIERWMAAHLLASSLWRTTKKEKLGDASVEYTGSFGMHLSSTPYGQVVLQLDVTGKMGNVGKKGASVTAIKNFE